jgi:hypothetical protein
MVALPANVVSDALSGGPNQLTTLLAGFGIIPPQWGIFNSKGSAVVTADTVVAVEYRQDWQVSDYPQESGAFQSYDKVSTPFEAKVMFASGGSVSNRKQLLASIKSIAGDLNLYDVVTPEVTYLNCNVVHYDYRRADGKAGMIEVTVHLLQIVVTGQAALSGTNQPGSTPNVTDAQNPGGNSVVNGGQVQPTSPTTGQQIAVNSAISNRAIAAGA